MHLTPPTRDLARAEDRILIEFVHCSPVWFASSGFEISKKSKAVHTNLLASPHRATDHVHEYGLTPVLIACSLLPLVVCRHAEVAPQIREYSLHRPTWTRRAARASTAYSNTRPRAHQHQPSGRLAARHLPTRWRASCLPAALPALLHDRGRHVTARLDPPLAPRHAGRQLGCACARRLRSDNLMEGHWMSVEGHRRPSKAIEGQWQAHVRCVEGVSNVSRRCVSNVSRRCVEGRGRFEAPLKRPP